VSKHADRVVFLDHTIQCDGTPEEVFANEKILKAYGSVYRDCLGKNRLTSEERDYEGVSA
jgi:ABC-type Mn2+/Zn2+ transport system ATPase subunit